MNNNNIYNVVNKSHDNKYREGVRNHGINNRNNNKIENNNNRMDYQHEIQIRENYLETSRNEELIGNAEELFKKLEVFKAVQKLK